MEIDAFWEHIFSDDREQVQHAWNSIDNEERASLKAFLRRVRADPQRIDTQRAAATFALDVVAPEAELPEGALEFAQTLARNTGNSLKAQFGAIHASLKRDGSLVTAADLESDRVMSAAILARYPDHVILSEEREHVFAGAEWTWVIDPIDGTTNFTWGFPCWGLLIGLLHNGEPVMSVADFPALDEHYHAVRGAGAFLNGAPIRALQLQAEVPGKSAQLPSHLFATCSRTLAAGPLPITPKARISGSTGYDLAMLASGVVVGMLQKRSFVWDVAGVWVLVEEAGGVVTIRPEKLFPLVAGQDYGSYGFSVLGAASQTLQNEFEIILRDRF